MGGAVQGPHPVHRPPRGPGPEGLGDEVVVDVGEAVGRRARRATPGAQHVGGPGGVLGVAGAHHGDPPVPELEQVPHRDPGRGVVVDLDARQVADPAAGHRHVRRRAGRAGRSRPGSSAGRSGSPRRPCAGPAGRAGTGCARPRRRPGRPARRDRPRGAPAPCGPASRRRTRCRAAAARPRPGPCCGGRAGRPRARRRRTARRRSPGPAPGSSGLTPGTSRSARDTVAIETPARRATSAMLTSAGETVAGAGMPSPYRSVQTFAKGS